jgi:hypothetical protein
MLREVGLGDRYLEQLGPWREMLAEGLSTWAEQDVPASRSDCHAWGASPNFEVLRTIAGIESAAPGFAKVRISPNLGALPRVTASMPHPKGAVQVSLTPHGADVALPPGITGDFEWKGTKYNLHPGPNHLTLP